MRVAIAGAGAVGRSVAAELLENGHEVLLIDKDPRAIKADSVPNAEWLLADACELASLDEAALQRCDVVIAGAGSVGRSIARELLRNGHHVLLIDRDADGDRVQKVPDASWLQADACEIEALSEAGLADCDVVVAATGDDKVNLVLSLLAKTEFGVPRTVARVNNPKNEWMFDEAWGVDVAVSTPRLMTALVEEAVSVGDLVRIFEFQQGKAMMVEMTLPVGSPYAGSRVGDVPLPGNTVLTGIIREGHPIAPSRDDALEPLDELLFLTSPDVEAELESLLSPGQRHKRDTDNADDDDDA